MNDHSTEVVTRIAASTRQVRRPGSVKRSSSMDLKENRNIACLTPIALSTKWLLRTSLGVRKPRHLRGRLLRRWLTRVMWSSESKEKSVFLGMYCLTRPFVFSLVPLCQEEYGSAKKKSASRRRAMDSWRRNSKPLSEVIVKTLSFSGMSI